MSAMEMDDAPLIMLSVAIAIVFGLMTALLARAKGRGFIGWLFYGALSPPFAFFHALLMASKKQAARKRGLSYQAQWRCPHCGEAIKAGLEVCSQCWRALPEDCMTP